MLAPLHRDRQCELAIGILFDCTYALYTSGVPVKFERRQMKIEQPKRVTLLCHLPCPLGIASPYKLRAPLCSVVYSICLCLTLATLCLVLSTVRMVCVLV